MWARLEYPKDVWHVIPVDDLREHEELGCWCKPSVEQYENGNKLVSHNAADFREFDEAVKEGH